MKKISALLLAVAAMTASNVALADQKLAQEKNCMTCHAVANKVLGPSFTDVSKKYAGNKAAEATLVTKVMKGGTGVWGAIPMPANPQVTQPEAERLVKWILTLK